MVARMNENLQESNETSECHLLTLKENSVKVQQLDVEGDVKVFQVTYQTLPGNGQFWGFLTQNKNDENLKILSERFPRLDSYDAQSRCASEATYVSYCYCKNLLKTRL